MGKHKIFHTGSYNLMGEGGTVMGRNTLVFNVCTIFVLIFYNLSFQSCIIQKAASYWIGSNQDLR